MATCDFIGSKKKIQARLNFVGAQGFCLGWYTPPSFSKNITRSLESYKGTYPTEVPEIKDDLYLDNLIA